MCEQQCTRDCWRFALNQHVQTKSMLTFQLKKHPIFTSAKSQSYLSRAQVMVPFQEQMPTFTLFGGDDTECATRKTNREYGKKAISLASKVSPQSESTTPESEKKAKINPTTAYSCPLPIG